MMLAQLIGFGRLKPRLRWQAAAHCACAIEPRAQRSAAHEPC
jgi:hypothetical protein